MYRRAKQEKIFKLEFVQNNWSQKVELKKVLTWDSKTMFRGDSKNFLTRDSKKVLT